MDNRYSDEVRNPAGLNEVLRVTEIFKSIQGESSWAGLPCIFIRLTGCPLRCSYCDTAYAYEGGAEMTIGEILEQCVRLAGPLVEVTGGEPLFQEGCPLLVRCLLEHRFTVLVETSGALPIGGLPHEAIRIMDLKCPGSGMSDKNHWDNIEALTPHDEVKFVIGDRVDYEWSRDILKRYNLKERCREILFAPAHGVMESRILAEWILEDALEVRFQLQLHKHIWPEGREGV